MTITMTTTQTTSTTATTTQIIVRAPTAIGPWPYFLVLSLIAIAAWRIDSVFTKFLPPKVFKSKKADLRRER